MKAIKRVGIDLIKVSFRFVHLTVVVVKKQFVLKTLTECFLWTLLSCMQGSARIMFSSVACLPLPFLLHYIK
jgi:hypothetical protein